jgi:hypothetical protein
MLRAHVQSVDQASCLVPFLAGPVRCLDGPGDHVAPSEYRTEIEMPIVRLVTGMPV